MVRIFKVQAIGKVIDEYIPFSDTVIDFDLKDVDGKTYLIVVGTDLKDPEKDKRESKAALIQNENVKGMFTTKITPTQNSIPSIKIFDFTKCIEKTNCEINSWKEYSESEKEQRTKIVEAMLSPLSTIYLMRKKTNENEFYAGSTLSALDDSFEELTDISCFSVAPKINAVSFSLGNDCLVQIRADDNTNLSNAEPKFRKFRTLNHLIKIK